MSKARDAILSRLRCSHPGFPEQQAVTGLQSPTFTEVERIERFCNQLQAVRAEVHLLQRGKWAAALQQLAQESGIKTLLYAPDGPLGKSISTAWDEQAKPHLKRLEGGIEHWKESLFYDTTAAVTSVRAGIASTGTLVLWPTVEEPRSWSLVPPIHIAVLETAQIHDSFERLIEAETWHSGMPTNALLISGPSKTADIEQTLSYGIHGPMRLIVLLLQ